MGFTAATGGSLNAHKVCFDGTDLLKIDDVGICEGSGVELNLPSAGKFFGWNTTKGIDDPTSLTPFFSPTVTTTYEVTYTSFCDDLIKDTFEVKVNPLPEGSYIKQNNLNCAGTVVPCTYDGPSILINEINISPSLWDGSLFSGENFSSEDHGEGEWIELYNPNRCDPVDVSGFMLGTYNSSGNENARSLGMGVILTEGTVVPPNGFLVVRGRRAPKPADGTIDIVITGEDGMMCLGNPLENSRFWFANSGGWFGFYDRNGVPQDMISWGTPIAGDLNQYPCIPDSNLFNGVTVLPSYTASGIGVNVGNHVVGKTFVRIPDGGSWATEMADENTSIGSCNDPSTCAVGTPTSSCNGYASMQMTQGTGPFKFLWDDIFQQRTETASSLCAGLYTVVVTDVNACSVTYQVEIEDEFLDFDTIKVLQPICIGDSTAIEIKVNREGEFIYTWNPAVSNTNLATLLSAGDYQIQVSDGFVCWILSSRFYRVNKSL